MYSKLFVFIRKVVKVNQLLNDGSMCGLCLCQIRDDDDVVRSALNESLYCTAGSSMANTNSLSYSTGLYIPVDKQSIFMLAFEDKLVTDFKLVPLFGSRIGNTCELRFKYLKYCSYKPQSFVTNMENAVEFLRSNMSILGSSKTSKRKTKRKTNSFLTSPQVINLEDDSEVKTVDLTNSVQGDPEVIVLEDSIVQTRRNSNNSSLVDLTDFNDSLKIPANGKATEDDIAIIRVEKYVPKTSPLKRQPSGRIKCFNIPNLCSPVNNVQLRKDKTNVKRKKKGQRNSSNPGSPSHLSSKDSLPRKKRKLQDISNINSAASSSTSPSSVQTLGLSENVLKYYKNIAKVACREEHEKNHSNLDFIPIIKNTNINGARKKERKNNTSLKCSIEPNGKRKVYTTRRNSKHFWSQQTKSGNKSTVVQSSSPGRILRKSLRKRISKIGEANSFNPNPHEVDTDGLRPIVIDGCNVAIGHGKGKFSSKGLKICVDYFAARGHTNVKMFLPQFRKEEFSAELLTELKTKCDVVFTPSQFINGRRRTPYDDRFIVQYATEFGGVIVSTDHYRDVSQENPRWQYTIANRLLMFTWVDDFLMFPVDPLGRSGPTLEEFLRF